MIEGRDTMRRHGAQARPAEEDILGHLERILGARPRSADFLEPGRNLAAALQLAECEARLDRAHRHYAAAQDVHRLEDFDYLQEHLEDLMYFDWTEDGAKREVARRIMRLEHVSKRHANHKKSSRFATLGRLSRGATARWSTTSRINKKMNYRKKAYFNLKL